MCSVRCSRPLLPIVVTRLESTPKSDSFWPDPRKEIMMLYPSFVKEIGNLDFIQDEDKADAALKWAIGSLVTIMEDDAA